MKNEQKEWILHGISVSTVTIRGCCGITMNAKEERRTKLQRTSRNQKKETQMRDAGSAS